MEFDVVKPIKPKLYKRYVDDVYSKRIKNQSDKLFEKLNNYRPNMHPNMKLTLEVNPSKSLNTEIMIKNVIIETSVVVKESRYPITGHQQSQKNINEMQFLEIYRRHMEFQVTLNLKISVLRKNILALISRKISFSLLLILISKNANP